MDNNMWENYISPVENKINFGEKYFPISGKHPAVEKYENKRQEIIKSLESCGNFTLTLLLKGTHEENAKPVIKICCEYPEKSVGLG